MGPGHCSGSSLPSTSGVTHIPLTSVTATDRAERVEAMKEGPGYTRAPMKFRRSFNAPIAVLVAAVLLVGCGSQATPSSSPPVPVASASANDDPIARAAFGAAICPIFDGILEVDPRLAAMREVGSAGGDVSGQSVEIGAVKDELLVL